jgi:hypothetical protein
VNFYKIKLFIIRLTPPLLLDFLLFFYKNYIINQNNKIYKEKSDADELDFEQIYYLTNNSVFNIPIENVRHLGGQSYSYTQHHFMKYLKEGIEPLEYYYNNHKPNTIFEKHFISNNSGNQKFLPWAIPSSLQLSSEYGIGPEHGHSAFGPVSKIKLKLEVKRLDYCLKSIESNGYLEIDKFTRINNGFPRGYFLVSNKGNWTFMIVGAKHRVAVLAHLGWKNIPVCIEPHFPNCIFEKDISKWPGVISGEYSKADAKLIFDSYFRNSDEIIWS